MKRIILAAALALMSSVTSASAQNAPDSPPSGFAVVAVSPSAAYPGFIDLNHLERGAEGGFVIARVWLVNVFRTPQATDNGPADASWVQYVVQCSGGEYFRSVAYWVTANGQVLQRVEAGQPRPMGESGSPLGIAKDAACNGVMPSGVRLTDLATIIADGRSHAQTQ